MINAHSLSGLVAPTMTASLTLATFFFLSFVMCTVTKRPPSEIWDKDHPNRSPENSRRLRPPKKSDTVRSPIIQSILSINHTRQFDVEVLGLKNGSENATVVLSASHEFDRMVLRYVVAYWPKRKPEHWNERFSGAGDEKNRVIIDKLQPGLQYKVLVTALIEDGTHEQVKANFSTTGHQQDPRDRDTHWTSLPPRRDSCKLDVTKWERVNKTKLHLKWSHEQCSARSFNQFAIIYFSRRDFRRVIAGINESDIVIGGLFEEPSEVMVEALTANYSDETIFIPTFKELPSILSDTSASTIAAPVESAIPVRTTSASVVTTTKTNGLLISVIILAILFVSSAIVATYLCLYLRMHRHEMAQGRAEREKKTMDMPMIKKTGNKSEKIVTLEQGSPSDGKCMQTEPLDGLQRATQL